jgi:4-amino-4-deoxy-L-arabinose transferase-like glycosyltransferase
LWAALLIFSLKFGADIRKIGYSVIPDPYIILDEHTNVWHGLSLRATGIPTAWSILSAYLTNSRETGAGGVIEGFNINVDGKRATLTQYADYPKPVIAVLEMDFGRGLSQTQIVQPYLDHPFFGALVLSLAVPKEVKTFAEVNNYDLRRMSLYLGILTQLLIFVLAYQITRKPWVGIMAGLIYATVPSYVLLSRYALLENVLSPLFLTNLILLIYARGKLANKKLFFLLLILAGFVGGLMALTKLAGWVLIAGSIILLYLWKFRFKQILAYAIPAILIGGLFFAWGLTLAPKLFLDLFLFQSVGRGFIGSINILVTAMRVSIFNFPVDGWWLGGFLALVFIPRKKECLPLGVGMIAVLASALVLVGANFPWYFIPLIPLMCIAVALFFANLATAPTAAGVMLAFFVFVSSTLYWGYGVFVKDQPFNLYRFAFLLFLAAAAVWAFAKRTRKYKKVWFGGIIVLMIVLTFLQRRGIYFILANWGKLPPVYTPGTF